MKNAKRYLAVVLSFALFLALPLAFTQEAAAASGTKVTQLSKVIETSTDYYKDGTTKTYSSVTAFAYDKKGLKSLRAVQDNDGKITGRRAYTYNKSGYMTAETYLNDKNEPTWQDIYTVKKGKVKAIAEYDVVNAKAGDFTKIDYKSGKKSKVTTVSADGKRMEVTTYKKGVPSQYVATSDYSQTVTLFDKYGNPTSSTTLDKEDSSVAKTVYKNTYKNGNLVKVVSSTAFSDWKGVYTGLTVNTYKKGKLVKSVDATTLTYPDFPTTTTGTTTTYAYTKGGLIKTINSAETVTNSAGTRVTDADVTMFEYKNVSVDKKCVKAVKESMEKYNYKNLDDLDW